MNELWDQGTHLGDNTDGSLCLRLRLPLDVLRDALFPIGHKLLEIPVQRTIQWKKEYI